MRTPCDEAVLRSKDGQNPCAEKSRPWILAATILASSMAFIDSTVVNVALPSIQANFHATVVDVQWVIESYGLFLAALILVGGSLGDLYGRRRIFVIGVVIFAAASAFCGMASSIHHLIAARSIQGFAAALLVPGSLAIISTSFDEESRGRAIGTWSGFTAITTAIGPVLGGWLVEHASWRWAFFINLPIAAAVIALSFWWVTESRSQAAKRLDWPGAILISFGLGGLVYGFLESANLGWRDPFVYLSLLLGFGCLAAFFVVEARGSSPMVPLALFDSHSFCGANLLTFFLYSAVGIFFFLFPLNLIQVQGYSATAAGAASVPMILIMFLFSRWSGGQVSRYGARRPLIMGPLIVALGFLLFALPSVGRTYWNTFFPAVVVLGTGMTITIAPLTTIVMNSVSQDRVGTASGINNAVARVAGVLAIAVLGIVMFKAFGSRLDQNLSHHNLPSHVVQEIQANKIKLAGMPVPADVNPENRAELKQAIESAFVFGFRIIMLTCVGLAATSVAVAWFTLPKDKPKLQLPPSIEAQPQKSLSGPSH